MMVILPIGFMDTARKILHCIVSKVTKKSGQCFFPLDLWQIFSHQMALRLLQKLNDTSKGKLVPQNKKPASVKLKLHLHYYSAQTKKGYLLCAISKNKNKSKTWKMRNTFTFFHFETVAYCICIQQNEHPLYLP